MSEAAQPVVVEREPFTMVGLSMTGKMGDSAGIGELWHTFMARAGEITPGESPAIAYGIFSATPEQVAAGQMTYMTGMPETPGTPVPDGMQVTEVPGGTFVKYTHHGTMDGLQNSFKTLYGWIAQQGLAAEGRPGYELYDERFNPASPDNQIDLFVPVKPA